MRLNSRLLLSSALFLALAACEDGSPNGPTPPPPPACSYTLSVTTLSVPASGGSTTIGVTTTSQCAWTATSDREWMTITGGASATGTGTVTVAVSSNPGATIRSGTLTVAGQAVAVTEAAQPACTVTLSPTSASFGKDAATGGFTVTTPSYCSWTAVSTAAWLTVTSGSPGQGNGTAAYSVARNLATTSRNATIVVNETSFAVAQDGDVVVVSCEYSVAPVEFTPCMSFTYDMTALVTTQATCSWTANATASWITVTEGQSGSGPGVVKFHVSANWDPPRQGIVEVRWPTITAGQNLRVLQAGCYYAVSTSAISVASAGGTARFDVVQASDPILCGGPLQNACVWTAVTTAPWITITTSMPQVGDNPVNFVVSPNGTGFPRTGTIIVRDKVVTVTQGG